MPGAQGSLSSTDGPYTRHFACEADFQTGPERTPAPVCAFRVLIGLGLFQDYSGFELLERKGQRVVGAMQIENLGDCLRSVPKRFLRGESRSCQAGQKCAETMATSVIPLPLNTSLFQHGLDIVPRSISQIDWPRASFVRE